MTTRRRFRTLLIIAALVLGGVPAISQTTPAIRVATVPFEAGAEPYYAQTMGFFKKAGLNVEIVPIASGAAISAAVAGGAADIGFSNIVSLATAHSAGIPIVVVAAASLYISEVPQSALVVAKNSPLASAKDLNGQVIAINGLLSIPQIGTDAWIDQNGGNSASIRYVEMTNSAISQAVASGRVAAGLLSEPDLTESLSKDTRAFGWIYDALGKRFVLSAWFTTSAWAHAHPDLVRRYVRVIEDTARWANTHQADSAKIIEAQMKAHITAASKRVVYGDRLDVKELQPSIDAAARYKVIKSGFPAAELIF